MIWHIARRELYSNLHSLRFALTTLLLLALMLTNAVVYLREHPKRVQKYRNDVAKYQNSIISHAEESLYRLAQKGPGDLYKKPSPLRFCAEGGEDFLSRRAQGGYQLWRADTLEAFWILGYPSATPNLRNINPTVTKVDWGFIIGYVLSLIALLFSFDSISSERERGTLRLMLANSVPRHIVLFGKFLGALISIAIPLTFAILTNLLVIYTSGVVHLGTDAWVRLGIIFCIALLYTCLFLALGLLVSARVQRSAVSLVVLLLTWVVLVVFIPSTLASIAGGFSQPMTSDEFRERTDKLSSDFWDRLDEYRSRPEGTREALIKKIEIQGEFVMKDAEKRGRMHAEHLAQQIAQVKLARATTRISPVAIVQHLLESYAGTGFERHLQFLENVKSHARQFRIFIADTDSADQESLHIFGVRAGMSQKPVSPEAVPKFKDTLSLSKDFNAAAVDLLLLTLFFIVLLSGAYLAFVRVEI